MKLLLTAILSIVAAGAMHGRALDPAARIAVMTAERAPQTLSRTDGTRYYPMIIRVADADADLSRLEELGVKVINRREDMVLAFVPREAVEELDNIGTVNRASLGTAMLPQLDKALAATHADRAASTFDTPYTGRGVVVGMSDIGFDPSHSTFSTSLGAFVAVNDTMGVIDSNLTHETAVAAATDAPTEFHATHVAGIMCGNGDGTPYAGVAPGATLCATTSQLRNAAILMGVEAVINYGRAHDMPAVVNLSLGSPLGPHDGSDDFTRYLDMCGAEVPIVLSAGNDGANAMSVRAEFDESTPELAVIVAEKVRWDYMELHGYVDAWSTDSRPVAVSYGVYDLDERRYVYESAPVGDTYVIDMDADPELSRYFSGTVMGAAELNEANNRYNVLTRIDLKARQMRASGPWARHVLVIKARGEAGTGIDICADCNQLILSSIKGLEGMTMANADLSVSSMASGQNTVTVGSATTRDTAPTLAGERSWDWVSAGTVSRFSSYGTLRDGRRLPHIAAPGAFVVSAVSRHYLRSHVGEVMSTSCTGATPGNYFMAEAGTSMAAPHVAGIFALWLEADPTLTPSELREIAIETASADGLDLADPRSGAGMIDAIGGLRLIRERLGVGDVAADELQPGPTEYYNLQGVRVAQPQPGNVYIRRCGSRADKIVY